MTQSGLFSIMPVMRFSPVAGTHSVFLMASKAVWRSVNAFSFSLREKVSPEATDEGLELDAAGARPSPVCSAATLSLRERDALRVNGLSIAINHCGVLRKITGFFERQECGY